MNKSAWVILFALGAVVLLTSIMSRREPAPSSNQLSPTPPAAAPADSRAAPPPPKAAATPAPQRAVVAPPTQTAPPIAPPQKPPAEPPVATPDAALQKLTRNSGLAFSSSAKVLGFSDGGVPDPSIGFYEWVVVSSTPLALPNGRQIGDNDVLNLPVAQAVQLVESKMPDTKIENPLAAFSIGWEKNGFSFSGTWVRGQGSDYLIVQQTRK